MAAWGVGGREASAILGGMRLAPAFPLGSFAASRRAPKRLTLLAAGAGVLGAALVLAREAAHGPGLGPDSVIYVEVARNLLEGEFFTQRYGNPLILQPPVYPALLAAASFSVFDPKDAIAPVNAAIAGATIFVAARWLAGRIAHRSLRAWSVLAVACAHPLVWAGSIGFPAALFILLSTLALIKADDFFREGKRSSLAFAALFSALAWLTHYTGIAVVVSIGALLLVRPGASLAGRAKRAACFTAVSSAPLAVWWGVVVYRTGDADPLEREVDYSFLGLAGDIAAAVSKWAFVNLFVDGLYPEPAEWPIASALGGAALLALAVGVGYGAARAALDRRSAEALWERWGSALVFGGFALAFIALYLTALLLRQTWDGAQDRHLVPAYLPLFIAGALTLDNLIGRSERGARALSFGGVSVRLSLSGAAAGALWAWLGLALALHLVAAREANAYGITRWDVGPYGEPRWAHSETIAYLRDKPLTGEVYTNQVEALALYAPGGADPRLLPGLDSVARWAESAPVGSGVVWFDDIGTPLDHDAADLRATPGLEAAAELADGAVFMVNSEHNPLPALRADYEALTRRMPDARSGYDLHLDGRTLAYVKEPCSRGDGAARFFLHVAPANADDLPDDRKVHGFENRDFSFESRGVRFEEKCVARAALPSYPIAEVRTGQFAGDDRLWEAEFAPGA